jgi:ABC-type multidrug transport system ATPase subunit
VAASPGVVQVDHLTKRFGSLAAVDDLSFGLEAGTVTGFLGPNGAGKTTTLRILLGLIRPTAGEALVFGRHYAEHPNPARRVGAVSSHLLAEVAQTVDRVVIIDKGKLVTIGALDELVQRASTLEDVFLELTSGR